MITRMESLLYVECLKRHSFLSLEMSGTGKVSKEGIFPVCCTVRMRRYCTKCLGNDLKEKKEEKKKKEKKKNTCFPLNMYSSCRSHRHRVLWRPEI